MDNTSKAVIPAQAGIQYLPLIYIKTRALAKFCSEPFGFKTAGNCRVGEHRFQ